MGRDMWRTGGIRALYAGLGVTLARAIPSNFVAFFAYEGIMRKLKHLYLPKSPNTFFSILLLFFLLIYRTFSAALSSVYRCSFLYIIFLFFDVSTNGSFNSGLGWNSVELRKIYCLNGNEKKTAKTVRVGCCCIIGYQCLHGKSWSKEKRERKTSANKTETKRGREKGAHRRAEIRK
jgi:hypothetical protein